RTCIWGRSHQGRRAAHPPPLIPHPPPPGGEAAPPRTPAGCVMKLLEIHEPGQTPLPHEGEIAIGIDLGTPHSVIAIATGGKAEVLHDLCGGVLIPSVVAYENDRAIVGKQARAAQLHGGDAVSSIKRLMGRGLAEANEIAATLPFSLSDEEEGMVRIRTGNRN